MKLVPWFLSRQSNMMVRIAKCVTQPACGRHASNVLLWVAGFCLAGWAADAQAQQTDLPRRIELIIQVDARAATGTQQRWMQALAEVGADRVLVRTGGDKSPSLQEDKLSSSIVITVNGIVEGNRLKLPRKSFAIADKNGIRTFLEELRDDGANVALAEKKAFGLTSQQLVDVHTILKRPVAFSTRGLGIQRAVEKIKKQENLKLSMDGVARQALAQAGTVTEELQGLSTGTVLAAILRPAGLVLQPHRRQGFAVEFQIVDSQAVTENWPIGWPIQRAPIQVEPRLFERLKLEIRGFPLSDAIQAIQKRAKVPFLFDHNAMAAEGIELSDTKVTLVRDQVSYKVAIGRLLNQTRPRMIEELRVDENGKAFLWITVSGR